MFEKPSAIVGITANPVPYRLSSVLGGLETRRGKPEHVLISKKSWGIAI